MAIFYFPQYEHEIFWRYLSRLNDFCAQFVDRYFLKSGKLVKGSLRVLVMNIGITLRRCTPGVWDICSQRLLVKFEISLNIWLMRPGSMKMQKRPLVTLFLILMLCMLQFQMRVSLRVYLMSNLILNVFLFHVIIVIPLIMMLILVQCLVDHTDQRHWLPLIGTLTYRVYSRLTLVQAFLYLRLGLVTTFLLGGRHRFFQGMIIMMIHLMMPLMVRVIPYHLYSYILPRVQHSQ